MGNLFGYMRISTDAKEGKQTFRRQEKMLLDYAERELGGKEYLRIFKDDCSGKDFEGRKEWKLLRKSLVKGDILVFSDVSRFSRNCKLGREEFRKLMDEGISLVFLGSRNLDTDYIKTMIKMSDGSEDTVVKFILEVLVELLILTELKRTETERLEIVKRIKQGIEASEKKSGRRQGELAKFSAELETDIKKYLDDKKQNKSAIKQIDLMKKYDIASRNTLKKYIKIVEERMKEEQKKKE